MLWSLSAEIAESSPWHSHEIFEFALCRGQGGRLMTDEGEIAFCSARTILVPPGTRHRFLFDAGEVGLLKIVCVPPKDLPDFLSPTHVALMESLCGAGVSVADHPGQEAWLDELGNLIADGLGSDDPRARQLNWSVLSLLLALHAKERRVAADQPGYRHRGKIREMVAWIEGHLEEALTIDEASNLFGLSRSLLTREFRHYTGKSFVDYCNSRRVQKAAMLLISRQDAVIEVAFACGFPNLSHFHRQFKAQFGLTPAGFRRKVLEDGGL